MDSNNFEVPPGSDTNPEPTALRSHRPGPDTPSGRGRGGSGQAPDLGGRPTVRYESVSRRWIPGSGHLDSGRQPNVITVTGAGRGKTLLACNLALALAALEERVVVFDADLQLGDACRVLGCGPDPYSARDLTESEAAALDLGRELSKPRDNLWVLSAPSEPSRADGVSAEAFVNGVIEAASLYDFVIVDTPAWWDFHEIETLDVSGVILFVDSLSTHPLQGPKRFYAALSTLRLSSPKSLEHCLVLRHETEDARFPDEGPADLIVSGFDRIPAWDVLREDATIAMEWPESVLVVEHAPDSEFSKGIVALAQAMVVAVGN